MKISIKTLKNDQFQVEVELTDTIAAVKEKVALVKADLPATRQKLIHAGKVLKDETVLSETGISENDFIVCMVTKDAPPAKPKPTTTSVTASAAPTSQTVAAPPPAAAPGVSFSTPAAQPSPAVPPAVSRAPTQTLNPESIRQLTDMGFPQDQAEAALRAALGNSDLAVEYLMSGIPDNARNQAIQSPVSSGTPATPPAAGGSGIDQLRRHPQLNELRRLIQQNPAALAEVLEAIGQQNPELLRLIHANQAEFLAMMNEPITEEPPPQQNYGGGDAGGMPNPMQLIQMIQMLPPDQREAAAQSLGMTADQLQQFSQMIATLPPDQLQRLMRDAGGMGGGGAGGPPPGANVIRLTDEEMAAVNRLVELGFNQQDAVAAYLACDKNEGLAANLLLEGWSADEAGGGGF